MGGRNTNTTALIGAWSMDGDGDLAGFSSALDINALVAERDAVAAEVVVAPELPPLLLKSADEDDWEPLPLALAEPA